MNFTFQSRNPILPAALTIILLLAGVNAPAQSPQQSAAGAESSSLIEQMNSEIRALDSSEQMTPEAKARRIGSIARISVVRALALEADAGNGLEIATRFALSAIRTAPEHQAAILSAIVLAPAVARIEGGTRQILALGEADTEVRGRVPENPPSGQLVRPAVKRQEMLGEQRSSGSRMVKESARPNVSRSAAADDSAEPELTLRLGENTKFDLTADLSVEHDSNIFLTSSDEVADTIIRVTPGLSFQFGRSALTGGAISYQQSFLNYADNSAQRVSLASGGLQFGYDNGRTNFRTGLNYRQLNQNERAAGATGDRIFRRDLLDASIGAEFGLTSKIRLGTSASLGNTNYDRVDLIDNRQFELPVKLYFALTPRTSLSVGSSYRNVRPRGDNLVGPSSRDWFHSLGIRGSLAPKLSGEFNLGYRSRHAGDESSQSLWGFDGALGLALTAKSSLSFQLKRDFDIGAFAESLQSSRYSLQFSANPTDQWSFGAALSYFSSDYGTDPATAFSRLDRFWEGTLQTSYAFTRWFSTSADYSLRNNSSSLPTAEYDNNVLKLNMRFSY